GGGNAGQRVGRGGGTGGRRARFLRCRRHGIRRRNGGGRSYIPRGFGRRQRRRRLDRFLPLDDGHRLRLGPTVERSISEISGRNDDNQGDGADDERRTVRRRRRGRRLSGGYRRRRGRWRGGDRRRRCNG